MPENLVDFLLICLRQVQARLEVEPLAQDAQVRFADSVDSMGFAEFLALVADECGVPVETITGAAGQRFGTVAELAESLMAAGLQPRRAATASMPTVPPTSSLAALGWLAGIHAILPEQVESAASLDERLGRPAGWLENHAGICRRVVWSNEDPLAAAARAARMCLDQAGILADGVGALLVTSEAPPLLTGLAATMHHRLGLAAGAVALEIGGACTGFLASLWTAAHLLPFAENVLIVTIEAASRWLVVDPGPAGEAAALFGDAVAACLFCDQRRGQAPLALRDILLGVDGGTDLIRLCANQRGGVDLTIEGPELAARAAHAMAQTVHEITKRNGIDVHKLEAVFVHGGNGRMPSLIARQLGVETAVVKSAAAWTGNLGSASLPVAWSTLGPPPAGHVVWTAAGAGLQWGAALLGNL